MRIHGVALASCALALGVACSSDPITPPAPADASHDTTPDITVADAPSDITQDRPDAGADVATDRPVDVTMDAPIDAGPPVTLQVLHFSDWHGQIDPLSAPRPAADGGMVNENIGGAAALSAYFRADRAANPNTLTTTAGDEFGASPPLASFFDEEPAVLALNAMGLQFSTFGNHNFDRGTTHLQTMIGRATYRYVSSNLDNVPANLMGVSSPFALTTVGGVRIGLVGITNADATSLTAPGRLGTLTIRDAATAAMSAQAMARAAGAQITIALCHLGATAVDPMTRAPSGPLLDFARGVSGFALILGDHTDIEVNTVVGGQLVIENRSKGLTYARATLTFNPSRGAVTDARAQIVSPWAREVTPDPAVTAALMPFRDRLRAQLDGVVATASALLPRGSNVERLGEVAVGDLIADAIRARYNTQIAFVNGGGIRAPIPSSYAPANMMLRRPQMGYSMMTPYDVVAGDIYEMLPFGNVVVTRTITGRVLYQALERSVSMLPAAFGGFLQISGIRVTYAPTAPSGMRIRSVTLAGGGAIMPNDTTYTLATSDFTNSGGDGYTMLADGQGSTRELMAAVVLDYVRMRGMLTPATDGRIMSVP